MFTRKNIVIDVEGINLKGWFYLPKERKKPIPLLILSNGLNCLKEHYLDLYAEYFVKSSFAVIVYDQRNFGESEGEPRQEIDPWRQMKDLRAVVTYAAALDRIDSDNIGVFGYSLSGGNCLIAAALDKRIGSVVVIAPSISSRRAKDRHYSEEEQKTFEASFFEDKKRRSKGLSPIKVTQARDPNSETYNFLTGIDAPKSEKWRFKNWINEVTLKSYENLLAYEPIEYIEKIAPTPLLMILPDNDNVTFTDLMIDAFSKAKEPKKKIFLQANHATVFLDKWKTSAQHANEWFLQHLTRKNT